ncbi:MAG TPA: hypothetical protein VE404_04185 [Verrucomicrobiae bacterium]|nr:hypothetical protein [Verrucomicrobiae bacterium]
MKTSLILAATLSAVSPAAAITYTTGDILYVAYQNKPAGAEYIVDLGPASRFTTATTTFAVAGPDPADLDAIVGSSGTNIFVGLFGVLDPNAIDALFSINGPKDDFALQNSSFIGAVQQIDSFGDGLASFADGVPSGAADAASFASAQIHSYQGTLNGSFQGSLGGNVAWSVEARLSSSTGVRIVSPVRIHAYTGRNDPIGGTGSRQCIGFFTLGGDGTITYSPDIDCNFVPDDDCTGEGSSCTTGLPGICAAGTTSCQLGSVVCTPDLAPRTETCNTLDDDCDGIPDNVPGAPCTFFVVTPVDGDALDCTSPKTIQPTISWIGAQFDRFKVSIGTDPGFAKGTAVTVAGASPLHLKKGTWGKICRKAANGGELFIRVTGTDLGVRKTDPLRMFSSPVVGVTVMK